METCFQQHEERPTAPGKQHTVGTQGHSDIRGIGDTGTGPGNAATHLVAPAAATIPTAPVVSPSPLPMASSTFPVTYGSDVSPGSHRDCVTMAVTTDTGGPWFVRGRTQSGEWGYNRDTIWTGHSLEGPGPNFGGLVPNVGILHLFFGGSTHNFMGQNLNIGDQDLKISGLRGQHPFLGIRPIRLRVSTQFWGSNSQVCRVRTQFGKSAPNFSRVSTQLKGSTHNLGGSPLSFSVVIA